MPWTPSLYWYALTQLPQGYRFSQLQPSHLDYKQYILPFATCFGAVVTWQCNNTETLRSSPPTDHYWTFTGWYLLAIKTGLYVETVLIIECWVEVSYFTTVQSSWSIYICKCTYLCDGVCVCVCVCIKQLMLSTTMYSAVLMITTVK